MTDARRFTEVHGSAELLADLAASLQQEDPDSTVEIVVARALEVVTDADSASVTLRSGGRMQTLAATDDTARRADELQYELREGPCITAAKDDEWYRSGDAASDRRWPRWGAGAAELGIGSFLSVPLLSRGEPNGALNLYAGDTGRFDDRDEVHLAMLYATHVAVAISSSRREFELRTAAHSRHVIGMAQGILMERFNLSPDQSFALLKRYSNNLNLKLSEVAEGLIGSGQLPDLPDTKKRGRHDGG